MSDEAPISGDEFVLRRIHPTISTLPFQFQSNGVSLSRRQPVTPMGYLFSASK